MKKQLFSILLLSTFIINVALAADHFIGFHDSSIRYEGRVLFRSNSAELSWPGTSVYLNFKGSKIEALLKDQDTANYYNVILDGRIIKKIHTSPEKKFYLLAEGLTDSKHSLILFKRTEWDKGKTWLFGFQTDGQPLPKSSEPKRKIEFYGNSITCAYGVDDPTGNSPKGYFENNYESYAAITARHFQAGYHCIAKSGIGIMVSWFPMIMPEMYDRADPTDPNSKWDFKKYKPDIVVINLFQNDSWLVNRPEHQEFKARFGTQKPTPEEITRAYGDFLRKIRKVYPKTPIICALGNMDATREGSPWPEYIRKAVQDLKDPRIYTLFFPYKESSGHPSVTEQQKMAESLIHFIHEKFNW